MNLKRTAALALAVLMVLALFAGCGKTSGTDTPATQAPASDAPATKAPATQAPATKAPDAPETTPEPTPEPVDEGPYHFAKNYATDADGWPLEKYVYEQPLCDTDEVLTKWTTCYSPQYLPEDGFNGIETWQDVEKFTGVHIEYDVVDSANRQQNFSVLLASDELDDILDGGGSFYTGTLDEAVEEGFFADLYDLRGLMPNYMWEIKNRSIKNPDCMDRLFYKKTHLIVLYGLVIDPVPSMGTTLRQDWMDKLGMGSAEDVDTFEQLHEVLMAMKVTFSNNEYNQDEIFPYFIWSCGEATPGYAYCGYNTALYMTRLSYTRVVDGQVQFCGTTDDDLALMTMLNSWYNEGLISPNFQAFVIGGSFDAGYGSDKVGCTPLAPASVEFVEKAGPDPDTCYAPCPRTRLYKGQTLEYGNKRTETHYGSCVLNAKCENLELAVAWCDWWMSDFGGDFTSWGPEGLVWHYNEEGERELEDWVIHHEASAMSIMQIYCNDNLVQFCLHDIRRSYYYPGGRRALEFYDVWTIPDYGGHYDWPSGVVLTAEQTDEAASIRSDLETFYAENYVSFINGVRPLSGWDDYIRDMNTFGLDRLTEIYQEAYDAYKAS